MTDNHDIIDNDATDAELANQQALKYGKDLARIYIEEKAKREKLEVAYQTLNAIFASTPDGLVVLDDTLIVRQANTAFEKLVNLGAPEVIGKAIDAVLLTPELVAAIHEAHRNANAPSQVDLTITKPTRRFLRANIARLKSGQIRGWVITIQDQSLRKQMEYQKTEFINIAAHELRTPLASVIGYSELVQHGLAATLDPFHAELVDATIRGARRLSAIVDELVQFADLNSGSVQPGGITTCHLASLIEDIGFDLQQRLADAELMFQTDLSEPDLAFETDAALLRTVLFQLIMNAINFNKPGGYIRVAVAQNDQWIDIQVQDSGIGIAQADLEVIFQPFSQVEDHNIRKVGGLGLGLSIARRAITDLTGTLSVESVLGQGSTFSLRLPLYPPVAAEISTLQTELETSQRQSLAYARDIQAIYLQLRQAHKELQEVNVQLEESNKLKSSFLGLISHELRSPFVSVDFALQTFERYGTEQLVSEQRDLFTQMKDSLKEARKMIDSLVNYAGLLSKQGRFNLESVDVGMLINETATILRPMAESHGLNWVVKVPTDLILPVADKERLGEALWHLMHNAIKFTKAGGQVMTSAYLDGERLVIEVKDTGIGVSSQQQSMIWEAFGQLSDPLKRSMEGLGLGLALVRYVAVAHGGNVILQSEPGVGSVFGFWIPTHQASVAAA
ncbi:MAG: ATP-binding protein [Chloroflexota bacterium]